MQTVTYKQEDDLNPVAARNSLKANEHRNNGDDLLIEEQM